MTWRLWAEVALGVVIVGSLLLHYRLFRKEVSRHDEHEDGILQANEKVDDVREELHQKLTTALNELDRWKAAVEAYLTERVDDGPPTGKHAHKGETAP